MSKKAKILVVDDELPVCKSIIGALADQAYTVDMAQSGAEAIEKERQTKYDVIVADLMMPNISGMELLKILIDERPELKVIMITGYPSIQSAVEATKKGAFDYIPKPFTPNDLRSVVARALESKRFHEDKISLLRDLYLNPENSWAMMELVSKILERSPHLKEEKAKEYAMPEQLFCIPENSWALVRKDGTVRVGIHHVFLKTIMGITAIELPRKDDMRYQGEVCLRVRDINYHVHKVWSPISGRIIAINEKIVKDYSKLVDDPYEGGWILLMEPIHLEDDLKNLLVLKTFV